MLYLWKHLFCLLTICLLLYFYFTRHFNHWKNKNVPFLRPIPFFGNVKNGILLRHSAGEIFYEIYQKSLEPVLGFFMLDKPCLLIRDPEIIKRILITDFHTFHDRSVVNNKEADPVATHILFFLKNPDWRIVRSKITPIFTSSKMKSLSLLVQEKAEEMIDYLSKKCKENSVVEMKEISVKFTVDVITSTVFGVNSNCFKDDQSPFWVNAQRITNWASIMNSFRLRCYFLSPRLVNLLRLEMFDPTCTKFLKKSFWEIMNQRSVSRNRRNDMIDILLQMKNDDKHFIGGDILFAQTMVFFVAGFETTSGAIALALHELAQNPDIQTKLRNEINRVAEEYGGISYDSLNKMEYLDMCIKEVLRKHPIAPFLERQCNRDYVIPETGTVIDKGTSVFVTLLGLHHDPQYFPDPEKFDPERFSHDKKFDSFCYLPFGEGPRNCIGARFGLMTVKYALVHLLKNFTFDTCLYTCLKIKYNPRGVVLVSDDGINLEIKKIKT